MSTPDLVTPQSVERAVDELSALLGVRLKVVRSDTVDYRELQWTLYAVPENLKDRQTLLKVRGSKRMFDLVRAMTTGARFALRKVSEGEGMHKNRDGEDTAVTE